MATVVTLASTALATIFGSVRGVVHDPEHRPISGTMVMLRAKSSDWSKSANTDTNGEFVFSAVPVGEYSISVASPGFSQAMQIVVVNRDRKGVV